jgi:hypothetical protein
MKNPLTIRSKDFLFCITWIWEELAPASDGSHRYRHKQKSLDHSAKAFFTY